MKKKLFAVLLCTFMCIGAFQLPSVAKTEEPDGVWSDYVSDASSTFNGGSGTAEQPYEIATAEQLAKLADDVNSGVVGRTHSNEYFTLTNDIDLSAHRWIPIGIGTNSSSTHSFSGYFDGNNHKITGLYVDESNEKFGAGLFGNFLGYEIKNLTVENAYVKTEDCGELVDGAGILIGNATLGYGMSITVTNCHVSGTVESSTAAGGLVGNNSYGVYKNCTSDVTINGAGSSGGFVGFDFVGSYTDCISRGKVNGTYSVGGFAGQLFNSTKAEKCLSYADVTSNDWHAGGFVGYTGYDSEGYSPLEIKNCAAYGNVTNTLTGNYLKTGGFAGTNQGNTIKNCHCAGTVTTYDEENPAGGFIGFDESGVTSSCSYDFEKNSTLDAIGVVQNPDTHSIDGAASKKVLSNICVDYFGSHDYDETKYIVDEEATCTVPGKESHHCKRCDSSDELYNIIEPGHSYGELIAKVDADCENSGYAAHYKCSVCNKLFDENKVEKTDEQLTIAANGHSYGGLIAKVEADCENSGYAAHYKCSVCNKLIDENKVEKTDEQLTIAANGHSYGELIAKVDADCENSGYAAHYKCSVCNKLFDENKVEKTDEQLTIAANGHNWSTEWSNDSDKHWHECNRCHAKKDEAAHTPYTADDGSQLCSVCEYVISSAPTRPICGDANGDEKVNSKDVLVMRKSIAKWDVIIDKKAADCNADGTLDSMDVLLLRKFIAKWNVKLGW